jgi:hypothetical protein
VVGDGERYVRGGRQGRSIGIERVFEYYPLVVSFTLALGFGAILASWSLLPTLDAPLPTCFEGAKVSVDSAGLRDLGWVYKLTQTSSLSPLPPLSFRPRLFWWLVRAIFLEPFILRSAWA